MWRIMLIVLALAVVLCVPVPAQDDATGPGITSEQVEEPSEEAVDESGEEPNGDADEGLDEEFLDEEPGMPVDLTAGSDHVGLFTVDLFSYDQDGNVDWLREYDGRNLNAGVAVTLFDTFGYAGPLQYRLLTRDITLGNELLDAGYVYRNLYGIDFFTSALTHRLAAVPDINPYLADTPAAGGDDVINLSPGSDYYLDRRVTSLAFRTTPGRRQAVRLVAGIWAEAENGVEQLLFRARQASPLIANRARGSVALPINRDTAQTILGGDFGLGRRSVVNYRFVNTDHDNDRSFGGGAFNFLPLNDLTKVGSDTQSHVIKSRSRLSDRLFFAGAQTFRDRTNTNAQLVNRVAADTRSTNLGLTYLATDALSLTAKYRRLDRDSEVDPLLSGSSITNQQLSKKMTSAELSASYTGLRRAYLQIGYERRDTDRTLLIDDLLPPFTSLSTEANIFRIKARYYPTMRLSVSGSFENYDADNSGYSGIANEIRKAALNATYLVTDNFALYGDFSMWDEKNDQIRVAFADIPTLPSIPVGGVDAIPPDYAELRDEAAGQGYDSDNRITTLGAWYALSDRLVVDANFSHIEQDTSNLWIYGVAPGHQQGGAFVWDLPHLFPNVVAFDSADTLWSLGATYSFTPRLRIFGRFLRSSADGQSVLDEEFYPDGIPSRWTPFDIDETRYTLGVTHNLTLRDTLQVSYSLSDWDDNIDESQSGKYHLWRFAWGRQF